MIKLKPGDYVEQRNLSDEQYHAIAKRFLEAGCKSSEYTERRSYTGCKHFGWHHVFGLFHGNTYFEDYKPERNRLLTPQQILGDDMTITTEWPEAGWKGECRWDGSSGWRECVILDHRSVAIAFYNRWSIRKNNFLSGWQFRPIRTEREKLVDAAMNAYSSWVIAVDVPDRSVRLIAERFYDCGLLRLPEGDDK